MCCRSRVSSSWLLLAEGPKIEKEVSLSVVEEEQDEEEVGEGMAVDSSCRSPWR